MFFAGLISQALTDSDNEFSFGFINDVMLEFGHGRLRNDKQLPQFGVRILKFHGFHKMLPPKARVIYVRRLSPVTLISFFEFRNSRLKTKASFEEFFYNKKFGYRAFIDHIKFWSERADLVLDYDDLLADFEGQMCILLGRLKVRVSNEDVSAAVKMCARDKAKNYHNSKDSGDYTFAAKKNYVIEDYYRPEMLEELISYGKNNGVVVKT
jgi:hypothetical protein